MLAFYRNEMGFGGNNGLTDFKDILGFSLQSPDAKVALFMATVVALLLTLWMCHSVVQSRAGRLCVAIRDAEARSRFAGYRVEHIKLWVFTLSAAIAGVAGALYVPQVGIINPNEFSPINSIEVVIWVAIGGRATLFGAVVGAVAINYAKSYLTVEFPEIWLFALGSLFVLVTLFLPKGIAGFLKRKEALA